MSFQSIKILKNLVILLIMLFFSSCNFSENKENQIHFCFDNYKKAILNHDGKLGIKCVDSITINYYSQTLEKVIKFDSLKIENELTIDKYIILKIRQNIPYDSLIRLDGKSLLISLINHGIGGNSNISLYSIGKIRIENDSAIVERIINGETSPNVFKFYKENNYWRLSIFSESEHKLYNWGIKQAIVKSKLSEDDYILNYIKETSGRNLKKNIWSAINH